MSMSKRIVRVRYQDHTSSDEGDKSLTLQPCSCVVYGEVAKETDNYINVRFRYTINPPAFYDGELHTCVVSIIKSTIVELVELTEVT